MGLTETILPFRHFSAEVVTWAARIHRLRLERRGSPRRPYAPSVTVTAYGDESIRRSGVPEPVYLLGAYLCADGDELTDSLARFARGPKLHWRDTPKPVARQVCEVIGAAPAVHVVVAAAPLNGVREEAARQRALAMLTTILAQEHGITALMLERRQHAQDLKDHATVRAARLGKVLPERFELVHLYGHEERRLWVPDQVLGAYGDALAGDSRAWNLLARRVRVERLYLS